MSPSPLLASALLLAACGARTALPGGEGGSGVGSSSAASSSAAAGGCAPTSLELDGPGVEYLVADGERVFYSTRDHRIMAGDLDTGETSVLGMTSSMALAVAVTAHGDDVFFADENSIWRVPKAGGEISAVTEPIPQLFNLRADATGLYWTEASGPSVARDIVRRRPDGTRVTIAEKQFGVFGLWPTEGGIVFSTQSSASTILVGDLEGAGAAPIAVGVPLARFPFVLGEHAYWVEDDDPAMTGVGAVARVRLDGTGYERVLVEEDPAVQTTRAITDGARWFAVRVASPNQIVTTEFPVATKLSVVAESGSLISAFSLALTPKRLVWTLVEPGGEPSIQSRCLADLP